MSQIMACLLKRAFQIPPNYYCRQWLELDVGDLSGSGHRTIRALIAIISYCSIPSGSQTLDVKEYKELYSSV